MSAFLIVGLGNPGTEYAGNRHNIGFMAVDEIVSDYGFSKTVRKFGGALCEGKIGTHKVLAFRPLGYMNTSGGPTAQAAGFYKIPPQNIIVIHDELDLPLGKLRVKTGGGNGGHNGLKSLDAHIGKEYQRIRLGIGHPGDKNMVSDYVLSDFKKAEWKQVEAITSEVSKHIGLLIKGDAQLFATRFAEAVQE